MSAGLWIQPVKERSLAREIVLCSWLRHFTILQSLSLPRCINGHWLTLNGLKDLSGRWVGGGGNKDTPSDFKLCKQQTTKWTLPYTIISYLVSVQLHVQLLQVLFNCTKSCYEILKHKILEYDVLF